MRMLPTVTIRAPSTQLLVVSHPAVLPINQLVYAELAHRGYRVDLIVPARWRNEYTPERFDSIPLPELSRRFHRRRVLFDGRPQRHMYLTNPLAELRRRHPAVVFCEQEPFSAAAAQWGLAARAVHIPFGVQMAENLDRPLPHSARVLRDLVLPRASFVAARSASAAQLAKAWGARGDVRLIPHNVPSWPPPVRAPHEVFSVGYAGRLVKEKGLDTLVAAVRRLGPGVQLLVAGDGPATPLARKGRPRRGQFTVDPRERDMRRWRRCTRKMDVLVLPSRTTPTWVEQFGRVLVEAMYCGTPVVGSDSGEIPWVIRITGGGETFPEGDDAALARQLAQLNADPSRRNMLAQRGQERAEALFGVQAVADRFEQVLTANAGVRHQSTRPTKPRVALVAHGINDSGGMEQACAELIRHGSDEFDFCVVSAELAPELRSVVQQWTRIGVPARPIPLKFCLFWLRAGKALRLVDADLIHTVGAIVPNRVDLTSIHFCHGGIRLRYRPLLT